MTVDYGAHIEEIARALFGEPNREHSTQSQWRYGTNGSIAIEVRGPKSGRWFDHEQKVGGGPIDLVIHKLQIARDAAAEWLSNRFSSVRSAPKKVIAATYDYQSADRKLLFQVVRYQPKAFRQRRPKEGGGWLWSTKGLRLVPFRLPELLSSPASMRVFIVEGEKDVEALRSRGRVATCNPGGAGKWPAYFAEHFEGREVVVLPDNDEAGREHAAIVAKALTARARSVRVLELKGLPEKGDISDWLALGNSVDQLDRLAADAPTAIAAEAIADAMAPVSLITSPRGEPKAVLANAYRALSSSHEWAGVLAFDEFHEKVVCRRASPTAKYFVGESNWTDHDDLLATTWLQEQRDILVSPEVTAQAIEMVARVSSFHPVRDYLSKLRWDRKPRIDIWLPYYFGAEDTAYARGVGPKFLISAVARIRQPGCKADHVLVLEDDQGKRKSTAIQKMAEPWTTDELTEFGSKDAAMQLRGVWWVEIAELEGMSKSSVAKIKAFASRSVDRYRPPWGRRVNEYPRQCVLVGSCNENQYLRDATGGRRFWPAKCTSIDLAAIEHDRDQLWAEAVTRYENGEHWWIEDENLIEEARVEQRGRYQEDPWQPEISTYLATTKLRTTGREGHQRRYVTIDEILRSALRIGRDNFGNVEIGKWQQKDANRIAACLQALEWERDQIWLYDKVTKEPIRNEHGKQKRLWVYLSPLSSVGDADR